MSGISINTVKNIDGVEQISLLNTCTTRLNREYRIAQHSSAFHISKFSKISPPLNNPNPFTTFAREDTKGRISECTICYNSKVFNIGLK